MPRVRELLPILFLATTSNVVTKPRRNLEPRTTRGVVQTFEQYKNATTMRIHEVGERIISGKPVSSNAAAAPMQAADARPYVCVVVSASSLEKPFLTRLLRECAHFASLVVVTYGSHLFSGEPEDHAWFEQLRFSFDPAVYKFVCYDVVAPDLAERRRPQKEDEKNDDDANHAERDSVVNYHNIARQTGVACVDDVLRASGVGDVGKCWLLFLDGDEVPRGRRFRVWWETVTETRKDGAAIETGAPAENTPDGAESDEGVKCLLETDCAYKLANYWYFLTSRLRADQLEDSVTLMRRDHVTRQGLSDEYERDGILAAAPVRGVYRMVTDMRDGEPMFHHYSWVRSRQDLHTKVATWGHKGDQPWTELLRDTWRVIDAGNAYPETEFVHGYNLVPLTPEQDFLAQSES